MSFDKTKIYIALGIISFILIGIGLYFLFIKKKPYDCTKDPNCKSPSKCVDDKCIPYDCTKDQNCKSPSGCVNNACITGMSCEGNSCTPYTCTEDNCKGEDKHCKGNVCLPKNYKCTDKGENPTCKKVNGSINANCYKDTCYNAYYNLIPNFRGGCQSQEPPGPGESANDTDLNADNKVQKYCNNNPNCIGFYQQISSSVSNVATDIIPENCTDYLNDGKMYSLIYYKQKVL